MRPHKAIQHKLVKQVLEKSWMLIDFSFNCFVFLFIRFNFCSGSFGVFSFFLSSSSDDQSHVFTIGQTLFLSLPQSGVDCERIDSHRQMLGMHLRETFPAGIVLEELFKHVVGDLLGSVSVEFVDFFSFSVERVERSKLALTVAEENQEILALVSGDLFEDPLFGLSVHHTGKDAVLHRIQDYRTIGTRCWLFIKSRTNIVLI